MGLRFIFIFFTLIIHNRYRSPVMLALLSHSYVVSLSVCLRSFVISMCFAPVSVLNSTIFKRFSKIWDKSCMNRFGKLVELFC
jgi:hypothetical protein